MFIGELLESPEEEFEEQEPDDKPEPVAQQ
jgi:hypothetical protein